MLVLIFVSVFFLYLLLFSQNIFYVLNCKVQKFLVNNIYFRQVMIFFTIYFFTFVLNWYSPNNIFPKIFIEKNETFTKDVVLSIVIYVFFVLTTCLNLTFSIILFFLIFIMLNMYIKMNLDKKNKEAHQGKVELIDTTDPKNMLKFFDIRRKMDMTDAIKLAIILTVVIGFVYNLTVTMKEQGSKFKLIHFLFSDGSCL